MTQNEVNKKCEELNVVDLYINQGKTGKEINELIGINNNSQVYTYLKSKGVCRREAKRRSSLRELPIVNKHFGIWVVASDQIKIGKDRAIYWYCKCSKCGHMSWKKVSELKKGTSTRCKNCGVKLYSTNNEQVEVNALIQSKYRQIVCNLALRKKVCNLPFTITPLDLQMLYNTNNKCALSGISLELDFTKSLQKQNLSVDRIDPNKGYTPDNIQLVDKRINMMKQSLQQDEFIELCCKVADYSRNINRM